MDPEIDKLLPLPQAVFQILLALADGEKHGYAVMQDISVRTGGKWKMSPGTLYSAVRRMVEDGLIEELDERPDPAHDDERRRYYRLTALGEQAAAQEAERLARMVSLARRHGLLSAQAD
jgi:DNA-binding PadR family transcriptional regulator